MNTDQLTSYASPLATLIEAFRRVQGPEELYRLLAENLVREPLVTAILSMEEDQVRLPHFYDPRSGLATPPIELTLPSPDEFISLLNRPYPAPLTEATFGRGVPFQNALQRIGCQAWAALPIQAGEAPQALLALAAYSVPTPDREGLARATERYRAVARSASLALERLDLEQQVRQYDRLYNVLNAASQAIATQDNPTGLYPLIHAQLEAALGEVNFLLALYDKEGDTIHVPYAMEDGNRLNLPPLPLGQGLTSLLIRTRQPLLLVDDVERRGNELGAVVVGQPARSWLGVPLVIGGEAIGAMVVQDQHVAGRFNQEDLRLLVSLANPVALTLHNSRLVEAARRQAEFDKLSGELTSKLWASVDVDSLVKNALQELARAMKATRGVIRLEAPQVDR